MDCGVRRETSAGWELFRQEWRAYSKHHPSLVFSLLIGSLIPLLCFSGSISSPVTLWSVMMIYVPVQYVLISSPFNLFLRESLTLGVVRWRAVWLCREAVSARGSAGGEQQEEAECSLADLRFKPFGSVQEGKAIQIQHCSREVLARSARGT